MLKIVQIVLSVIVIAFAIHGLVTGDNQFQPFMMLCLAFTMLVMGLREFQDGKKATGWLSVIVFLSFPARRLHLNVCYG